MKPLVQVSNLSPRKMVMVGSGLAVLVVVSAVECEVVE